MKADNIKIDEASFATGFVLSFQSEDDFIKACPKEVVYHYKPEKERIVLLKKVWKAANIENKK